jgi:hypothetical protein
MPKKNASAPRLILCIQGSYDPWKERGEGTAGISSLLAFSVPHHKRKSFSRRSAMTES